jgi:hypothetical protein
MLAYLTGGRVLRPLLSEASVHMCKYTSAADRTGQLALPPESYGVNKKTVSSRLLRLNDATIRQP